jgi:hypothetical protein
MPALIQNKKKGVDGRLFWEMYRSLCSEPPRLMGLELLTTTHMKPIFFKRKVQTYHQKYHHLQGAGLAGGLNW